MSETVDAGAPAPESTPAPAVDSAPAAPPSAATSDSVPAAGAASAAPDAAAAADVQAQIDEIEAQLDGKPYKIPANAKLPWKRKGESGHLTIKELQEAGMRERDYHEKNRELAETRRQLERERAEEKVRTETRQKWLQSEREKYLKAARAGGEEWDAYQRRVEMLQTDPEYADAFEKAALRMEDEALHEHLTAREKDDYVNNVVEDARNYITEQVTKHGNGLDPLLIEQLFDNAVRRGAPLRTSTVDGIIKRELERHGAILKPVQSELAELKRQLNDLQATKATEQHNAQTTAQIQRAGTKAGQPVNGSPPGPARPAPYNPETESLDAAKRRLGWKRASA